MSNSNTKAEPLTLSDEQFLRKTLAEFHEAVLLRAKAGVFGELTLKLTQRKGKIEGAKILAESLTRPTD